MTDTTVKCVDAKTAKEWLDEGKAVLIDVREINEWVADAIPAATLAPLSTFGQTELPNAPDKIAVFHCRSGRRTEDYFPLFLRTGYKDIYHLEGGIIAWKDAGYPTAPGGQE